MKKRVGSVIVTALLLMSLLVMGVSAQENTGLMAGYAMEELIAAGDTTAYVLTGSGTNTSANDPICVSCIAVRDAVGNTVLLLSTDFATLPTEVAQQVRTGVSDATGVPVQNILVSATHTHSSLELNATYGITYQLKNKLYRKAAAAAQTAIEDLSPATVSVGSVDVQDMNFIRHAYRADGVAAGDNHRKEGAKSILYGYQGMSGEYCSDVDNTMHLLQFSCEGEQPIVLTNWRCHATTFSAGGSSQISADFIGSFRDQMAQYGYRTVYFQGAAGDVNPRDIIAQVENPDTYTGPERVAYGKTLAESANTLLTGSSMENVGSGLLRTASFSYTSNPRTSFNNVSETKTDAEVYAKAQEVFEAGSAAWADHWYSCEKDYGIYSYYHARAIVNQFNSDGTPKNTAGIPVEMSLFAVGRELAFLGVSGEMFTETSVALEQAYGTAGFQKTFVLGYANGHAGYLPTARAYEYGCYEADTSKHASGVAEGVQAAFTAQLSELDKYCQCGGFAQGKGSHKCEDVTWQAWTETTTLPATAGNYKLMNDVTLSAVYTPAEEVHLDLNGHTIQKSGPRVMVVNGHDLSVTDTSAAQTGTIKLDRATAYATGMEGGIVWVQNGTFTLYGGTVDGSMVKTTAVRGGAAVNVAPGRNFVMYGGKVVGGEATVNGGAVSTCGLVELYGGTVTGGKSARGGNIVVLAYSGGRGLLRMYGGTVQNGEATAAGGNIAVIGDAFSETNLKYGEAYLYGGLVTGGTAPSGGNVAVLGGKAELLGGEITAGTATVDGGNILVEGSYNATYSKVLKATLTVESGTVSAGKANHAGNLSVRGCYSVNDNTGTVQAGSAAVTVTGGTITSGEAQGYGGNIQVGSGAALTISGGTVTGGSANHGGNISVNKVSYDAEGVLTYGWSAGGSLNISKDAKITAGTAVKYGGNILLFGALNMSGGEIKDGTASTGKNLRVETGSSVNLSGGQIAGGFYVNNTNSLTLSGAPQILPELTSEGYPQDGGLRLQTAYTNSKKMNISGLKAGARIEIVMAANSGAFANLPETMPEGMTAEAYAGFFRATDATRSVTVDTEANVLQLTTGHIHCECGGAAAGMPGHTCQLQTWTAKSGWMGDNTLTDGGYYYLSGESSGMRVGSTAATKNVHLCLNGHTMNNTNATQRTVMLYGSLSVCDHDGTGVITGTSTGITEGTVIWMNGDQSSFTLYGGNLYAGEGTTGLNRGGIVGYYGTLNMYGGTITGAELTSAGTSSDNGYGGAVLVNTLNLYGGTINGSAALCGGAVAVRTGMHMTGGTINGGTVTNGAALYASGTKALSMSGGVINGGTASNNGGAVMLASASEMTVTGGTVNGGEGVRGGAFMVNGASTKLNIAGGSVNGGKVSGNGGAIFVNGNGNVYISGGTVEGGNVYVNGGKLFPSGGKIEEVVISSLNYISDFTVSGAPVLEKLIFKVDESENDRFTVGELTQGASIAVDLEESGYTLGQRFAKVTGTGEYANCFTTAGDLQAQQLDGYLYWTDGEILAYNADGVYTAANLPAAVETQLQLTLAKDVTADLAVSGKLYLELDGNTLSGNITGSGSLYLTDAASDDYAGNCGAVEGTVDVTVEMLTEADGKTYLVVNEDGAWSAHRYEAVLTHVNLKPSQDALGYKARFSGDATVLSHVTGFGLNLWAGEGAPRAFGKAESFENGQVLTVRLQNILAADGGETQIHASPYVTFGETTATGKSHATTMKQTLQTINSNWASLSQIQQDAVKALCERFAVTDTWELTNMIPSQEA